MWKKKENKDVTNHFINDGSVHSIVLTLERGSWICRLRFKVLFKYQIEEIHGLEPQSYATWGDQVHQIYPHANCILVIMV